MDQKQAARITDELQRRVSGLAIIIDDCDSDGYELTIGVSSDSNRDPLSVALLTDFLFNRDALGTFSRIQFSHENAFRVKDVGLVFWENK